MTKLFFATDIHGSDICWSKFLNAGKFYEADVLILGGDGPPPGRLGAVGSAHGRPDR